MPYLTFAEYVHQRDEGMWLPNEPIVASMGQINPFPTTQTRLDRLTTKPVKNPQQVKPASSKPIPSPISQHMKSINRIFG
jgi:hypothetical protein